ncbi:hypothetical protein ACFVFQ_27790 [Streptomyces sp. NPDC057743]|uniref:hypothetical protein n=1 Tax=Streptomyces sp. NPDC057743 TaxID=3346236 RepID=UPI0036B43611
MPHPPPPPWPTPPAPRPGCPGCAELAQQRVDAYQRGDLSAVTDANVLLRHHLRERHP